MDAASRPSGPPEAPPAFATTHWSVVLLAADSAAPEAQGALARLCQTYWFPVYAFFRREGRTAEEAEDLTQSFFAEVILAGQLAKVHPAKGRFRSFLLASARNFLRNDWNRSRRLKRGGGTETLSMDGLRAEEWFRLEPADDLSPEKLFDRHWAETLIEQVLTLLQAECAAAGQAARFEVLRDFVLGDAGDLSYAQVGEQLGLSESAVTSAIHRMRGRFRELLRREVAHTVGNAGEVEAELRDLLAVLSAQR
ncbi:MAG TPA: sigma-70 family RNA polymerase sigma factor [Verrucomicrobiota bacterium]|nr:sigma-70 family RNA polymerase sigma factor [Verrucomicrobiota bacterium]